METDTTMFDTTTSNIDGQRNGNNVLNVHVSQSQRPPQPIENFMTSSPHYQRPVQWVYPAIQRTSDDNANRMDILSDSDANDHCTSSDMEEESKDEYVVGEMEDGRMGRRQRDFVPDRMKDSRYWVKRIRNNIAAKRSREKRRMSDIVMEDKVGKLAQENEDLRGELANIKRMVQDSLAKEPKQGAARDVRDAFPPPQQAQARFVVGTSPQSLPLIIPTYPNQLTRFHPSPQEVLLLPQSGFPPQPGLPQPSLPQPGVSQPYLHQPGLPQPVQSVRHQFVLGLPQPGLPQPGIPQPGLPQHGVPQPGLPQHGVIQPGLPQPGLPRPGLPQPGLPQHGVPQQSLPQPSLPRSGLPQPVQSVRYQVALGASNTTLSNGPFSSFISPTRNMNTLIRPEWNNLSRWPGPYVPTVAGSEIGLHPNPLQYSRVEPTERSATAANGASKVRTQNDKVSAASHVEILPDKVFERTTPLEGSPTATSKAMATVDDSDSVSSSPAFCESPEAPSLAEINKLPHKLRARFLRSLCNQEENPEVSPTDSEVSSPSTQPTMNNDPILMNIKKEQDDDIPQGVDVEQSGSPSGPSNYHWIPPKAEFPLNPVCTIEEELEQARNLMPNPSRAMNGSESQAFVELAKAASDLVGASLQSKDFTAPSVRQLTRQRTRDMNQVEKYRDKRSRNNFAAKKCRDAKRLLTEYRSARSNFFEVENMTLRNEVESLTKDVIRLRELVRRKQLPLY